MSAVSIFVELHKSPSHHDPSGCPFSLTVEDASCDSYGGHVVAICLIVSAETGDMKKANPVVLVPGIMGSHLFLKGWTVWADSFTAVRLILNPSLLNPWISLDPGPPLNRFYGSLVRFFAQKQYDDDDLFLFGYDWRSGIINGAIALARFVQEKVQRLRSPIVFIAHSLGCLLVKWAIAEGLIPVQLVKLVVAAGPPTLGSANAFKSLIEVPDISTHLNLLLRSMRFVHPTLADQLTIPLLRSLMVVQSLLELMPPRTIPVFTEGSPQLFSAFQWRGWPRALREAIAEADRVQNQMATQIWPAVVPRKLILSDKSATETGYFIDAVNPFQIAASLAAGAGDGTVLVDSARAFGSDEPELLVDARHEELLDDMKSRQYLDAIL
jgi:hypothetical protein